MRIERIEQKDRDRATDSSTLKEEFSTNNLEDQETGISPQLNLRKMDFHKKKNLNPEEKFKLDLYERFMETFSQERPPMLKEFIDNLEKSIIINVLDNVHGHQREAAKVLGIKFTTLNEKIKKYKIRFKKRSFIYNS